ncbi:MAG: tubulin-like doman-containing protein, partial [candidate division WOR-3 bacterium]
MEVRRHINIFVGLGGTGSSVVNKLYHRIPRGGGFGYVIYDADIQVKPEGFPEDYFCPTVTERINAQEVCEEYRDVNRNGDFAREFNKYWPGCRVGADKCLYVDYFDATGLGQSRPKGFLGFLYHYNNAPENIVAKIERITANLGGVQEQNLSTIAGAVNIRIICSFAGGTGSGAFLDLAFLLKHLHPNFKIYGYFILGKAAMLGRTDSFSKDYLRAMANTYGALWELKYWMTSGRIFQKCYGENRCISLGRPPFDNVYLIDQNNGMNQNLTHWKKYEDLLADCLYDKLHRTLVSSEVQTVLNNNEAKGTILSMGRGILLYPRKDILRLLGLYLMRDYIEKYIAKQKDDEIRAQVPADIKTLNLLDEEGADHIKTGMMHFRLQGLTIPKFPFLIRDTLTRAMKEHNYESNLNAVDKEINNAIIQAQNYYNNVFPHYLQNKQNEFLKRFSNEVAKQGVSFLHGYLDNFIKYIESRIGAHKADTGFLADLYQARDNLTYKISVVKENRGKNRR